MRPTHRLLSLAGALALALILGVRFFGAGDDDVRAAIPAGETLEESLAQVIDQEPQRQIVSAAIGRGGSLYTALTGHGLSPQAAQPIFDAFKEVVELRKLRASDQVVLELDPVGLPQRVEIVRGPAERYEATIDAEGAHARRVEVATERRLLRLQGEVQTSLYEALVAAGGHPDVVVRVADLFAWDIDFFTDPRPGDRFDILTEEIYLDDERIGAGPIWIASYEGARASQTACRYTDEAGTTGYFSAAGQSLRKSLLKSPLNYRRISSTFSHRRLHPITKRYTPHLGVDFAALAGTPVVAVGDGTVRMSRRKGANGNIVIIKHTNGYETYYLHLSRFGRGVREGRKVEQGQVIGYVGSTGRSTGPHLDFRVKKHGRFINPLKLTLPPGPPVPAAEMADYQQVWMRLSAARAGLAAGEAMAWNGDILRLGSHLERELHLAAAGAPWRFLAGTASN